MDDRRVLMRMLKALLRDIQNISQRGAGYYTNAPFIDRYNRLLEIARSTFAGESEFLSAFVPLANTASVDPADKMKVTQCVVVEAGQLIAFVEEALEEAASSKPAEEKKRKK